MIQDYKSERLCRNKRPLGVLGSNAHWGVTPQNTFLLSTNQDLQFNFSQVLLFPFFLSKKAKRHLHQEREKKEEINGRRSKVNDKIYWQNNLTKNKFWQKATVFDQLLILTKAVILTKVWFRPKILWLLPNLWRPRFNSSNFGFSYSVSVRMTSFNNISSRRESILSITYARGVRSHSISVPVQSERLLLVGKSSNRT